MSLSSLIFLLYQVVVIAAIIHVVMDNRQPAKTMAWAMVIYFVPVIGIVAYLFFGVNTRRERYVGQRMLDMLTRRSMLEFAEQPHLELPERYKPLIQLFVNQSFSLPFHNNKIEPLVSGYDFFPRLLRDIASAKSHIHIDVYIFEDDALGQLMADALIQKAREGIEVRIIYDDVGCWSVSNRFFERMREAGIEVEPFMPVRFPRFTSKANYRNHRKIFIVDGRVGYIGGMNIAQRYVKGICLHHDDKRLAWRDTMLRFEGNGVYSLQRSFLIDWYFVDRTLLSNKKYYPKMQQGLSQHLVQTVTSMPLSPYPEILQGYVEVILAARQYVYIESPYFLPPESVFFALKTAAAAGVDVRLLVPQRSDARITEWASRSFLREAMAAGISVKFYEAGFLHSKLMVSDDAIATCGSTNVDFRSFENNFEANAFIFDPATATELRNIFLADEKLSVGLNDMPGRSNPQFLNRLGESLTRLFSPLL